MHSYVFYSSKAPCSHPIHSVALLKTNYANWIHKFPRFDYLELFFFDIIFIFHPFSGQWRTVQFPPPAKNKNENFSRSPVKCTTLAVPLPISVRFSTIYHLHLYEHSSNYTALVINVTLSVCNLSMHPSIHPLLHSLLKTKKAKSVSLERLRGGDLVNG